MLLYAFSVSLGGFVSCDINYIVLKELNLCLFYHAIYTFFLTYKVQFATGGQAEKQSHFTFKTISVWEEYCFILLVVMSRDANIWKKEFTCKTGHTKYGLLLNFLLFLFFTLENIYIHRKIYNSWVTPLLIRVPEQYQYPCKWVGNFTEP